MNKKTVAIAALVSVLAFTSFISHDWSCRRVQEFSPEVSAAFAKWSSAYKRIYASPEEKMHRLRIFAESFEKVRKWRLNYLRDFDIELNKFADLSDEEFGAKFGTESIQERIDAKYRNDGSYGGPNYGRTERVGSNPQSFDWRTKNAIPPVQTQSSDCSLSVGAYTAAAAATANLFIHDHEKGKQVLFSVQRLLDCRVPSYGCGQTYYDHDAYSMLIQKPATPDDYYGTFTGIPSTCKNSEAGIHQKFSKWSDVYPTEDIDLENTLLEKVLTVMVYMPSDVKLYKSGVYTSKSCKQSGERLYYQPMLVGYNNISGQNRKRRYGEKNNLGYWITQWAFGPDWGENGYMRVEKVTDPKDPDYNACSINSYPYYITPKSPI